VQVFVLGILAGVYIGFGAFVAIIVGGGVPTLQAENPGYLCCLLLWMQCLHLERVIVASASYQARGFMIGRLACRLQKLLFGAVFPTGLMLVVVAGAELFTGNTMFMGTILGGCRFYLP
jgi:formate transporter